jgi:hypothetical protein
VAGIPCGIDTKELRIRVGPNNMDMSVAAMNQVADMQVAETNPVVDMVVAETNPVAVGRGARGKRTLSQLDRSIEDFEMATEGNNMDIEVAATNPVIVTNTPMSNHGIGADEVLLVE